MPFTLSHAAVAAPLARRGLILSAVAAGSIAPDLEYFLRLSMTSRWSHTFPGIFVFSLPAALISLWVFHALLKRPLIALTPTAHRDRLSVFATPFAFGPWPRLCRIIVSVLVGLGSHLLFDAWSHIEGIVVQHWAWLRAPLLDWPVYRMPVYEAVQAGLSVVLLLAIVAQYWKWFRQAAPTPAPLAAFIDMRPILLPLAVVGVIGLICGLAYAAATCPPVRDALSFRVFGGRAILAGLPTFTAGLVIVGWIRERTTLATVMTEDTP